MAKRILLVDDEPLILKGLRFTLEQEGYEILTAADGEEALKVFFEEQVDLVLLDVMLPKLDGIQVCQRIRESSNVPILMLTAKGEDMDKILGLEYGADDYMTKPFNILEVKARIKSILRRASQPVDLVLLDVMLPKMDGIQVCQRIRESSNVPILMLTAKGEDMDKILGLEYGADDYMTKPFNILEVKARIKTVLRRAAQPAANEEKKIIRVHDMEVNIVNRSVTLGGKEIRLTAKEFDLLQLFITNRGKVFSRETMLETVWKYDYMGDARTVDVHIRRLREKIERNTAQPEFIFTKWGVGYYFTDKD